MATRMRAFKTRHSTVARQTATGTCRKRATGRAIFHNGGGGRRTLPRVAHGSRAPRRRTRVAEVSAKTGQNAFFARGIWRPRLALCGGDRAVDLRMRYAPDTELWWATQSRWLGVRHATPSGYFAVALVGRDAEGLAEIRPPTVVFSRIRSRPVSPLPFSREARVRSSFHADRRTSQAAPSLVRGDDFLQVTRDAVRASNVESPQSLLQLNRFEHVACRTGSDAALPRHRLHAPTPTAVLRRFEQ